MNAMENRIIFDRIICGEFAILLDTTAGHFDSNFDFNYPDTLRTSKKPSDFYSLPSRCRFTAVFFFTNLARTWLLLLSGYCERYSQRRDNAISTHQKILTIYSLQDDKTHSNYVNTCNKKKNLIVQSYRSTSHVIVRSMFLAMLRCYPPIFA